MNVEKGGQYKVGLSDIVLQSLYEAHDYVALADTDGLVKKEFVKRLASSLATFHSADSSILIAEELLDEEIPQFLFDSKDNRNQELFLTIDVLLAIEHLPDNFDKEILYRKLKEIKWAEECFDLAQQFVRTPRDSKAIILGGRKEDGVDVVLPSLENRRINVLLFEDQCFCVVEGDEISGTSFSGYKWVPNVAYWMKGTDYIQVGNRQFTTQDIEFYSKVKDSQQGPIYLTLKEGNGYELSRKYSAKSITIRFQPSIEFVIPASISVIKQGEPLQGSYLPILCDELTIEGQRVIIKDIFINLIQLAEDSNWNLELKEFGCHHKRGDKKALDGISLLLEQGSLIGIMGPSGCGKSTFLRAIAGEYTYTEGSIKFEGIAEREIRVSIVPQEDVLFPNLTVAENLKFAQKLRSNCTDSSGIEQTLLNISLEKYSDSLVGDIHKKVLSGGQRKRLNIGLELVGKPDVLMLDEPTSGLSSADAQPIMRILANKAAEGMLVLAVVHQPSDEIFDSFDRVVILDDGGRLAFFGTPKDALKYFKEEAASLNPEFWNVERAIETMTRIERKLSPDKRDRVYSPEFWKTKFLFQENKFNLASFRYDKPQELKLQFRGSNSKLRTKFLTVFFREVLRKCRDWRNATVAVLTSAGLGFLIALVCRETPLASYSYVKNTSMPAFYFLAVILVQFLALSLAVQELVRDRKYQDRERLVDIPPSFLLISKLPFLFFVVAVQSFMVLLIGHLLLEIPIGFFFSFIVLLLNGVSGVLIGLFISSIKSVNEKIAPTLVPIILIPQLVLSGADPFTFERLSHLRLRTYFTDEQIPRNNPTLIANLMPARWSYQAAIVGMYHNSQKIEDDEDRYFRNLYNAAAKPKFSSLYTDDRTEFYKQVTAELERRKVPIKGDFNDEKLLEVAEEILLIGFKNHSNIIDDFPDLTLSKDIPYGYYEAFKNDAILAFAKSNETIKRKQNSKLLVATKSLGYLGLICLVVLFLSIFLPILLGSRKPKSRK